ncbi:MAG: hypothetical protein ACR2NN_11920 [Bryobacteraceae bacterium]
MVQVDAALLTTASTTQHATRQTAKLKEAASQFEAMLVTQMMQCARGSWNSNEDGQDSTMLELSEQQFAQALASSGGLGIAKMVVTGLTNHENR